MKIKLSELPSDIIKEIPLSLRTYKDEYQLTELPSNVVFLIEEYLEREQSVTYARVYDCKPIASLYGDLETIQNVHDLVLEYLKNYLMISPADYPFDPIFGCRLKYHLQTKDTSIRQILVSNEVQNIVRVISEDLKVPITINELKILKTSLGMSVAYDIKLGILINNTPRNLSLLVT